MAYQDNDPTFGGSHHDAVTTTTPAEPDPVVGGNAAPPTMLDRAWKSIVGGLPDITTPHIPGTSGPQPQPGLNVPGPSGPQPQPVQQAIGPGIARGVRDFWDKTIEAPNPEYGYTPSDADIAQIRQQNAADRAQFDKEHAGDPSAEAGRMFGQVIGTAPLMGPLGDAVAAGTRLLPVAGRGLLGIGQRILERGVTGGILGGGQAAATADPSQPIMPQIATGAGVGAGTGVGVGAISDVVSNAYRRLTGQVLRPNPYTGQLPDEVVARARNAQILQSEGVPIEASQVSNDPYLQFSNKYGAPMPGSGAGDFLDNQVQKFRNAALQRVEPGTPNSVATPDFITNNDTRIDGMYANSVQAVPSVSSTGPSGLTINREFGRIRQTIPQALTAEARGQINGAMNDVEDAFRSGGGQVSGSDAQLLTRRTNSTLSPLLNSDNPDVRNYGMQIRDQINQRLRAQMTPDQQATFDQANSQFRALRTVENAADANGSFQPKDLNSEATKVRDKFNSPGALDEIARAGEGVIQPALDGRSALGPRIAGSVSPLGAAFLTSAVLKPFVDMVTTGGAGTAAGIGGLVGNRIIQAGNRAGGPAAINAALSGGGSPVPDIQRALDLLRRPVVASQSNQ